MRRAFFRYLTTFAAATGAGLLPPPEELATATTAANRISGTINPPEVLVSSEMTSGSIIGSAMPPAIADVDKSEATASVAKNCFKDIPPLNYPVLPADFEFH